MNPNPVFSERENEVIGQLMQGCSNKQIAHSLGITSRTVEFHLGNIYAKLGVSSRAEAILRLTELQNSLAVENHSQAASRAQAAEPWDSTVENMDVPTQNSSYSILKRNPLMGRSLRILIYILLIVVFCVIGGLVLINFTTTRALSSSSMQVSPPEASPTGEQLLVSPTLTARESNTVDVLRLVEEYNKAVKEELDKGNYETGIDTQTGKNAILFQGESKERLLLLYDELMDQMLPLLRQYKALYIADIQPTPFPTQTTETENDAYFHQLESQYSAFFDQVLSDGPTVAVFDPGTGLYQDMVIGDAYARGEVMLEAMEALRVSSQIALLDPEAHIAAIRQAMDSPDLALTFKQISGLANAPQIDTALYADEQGNLYYVSLTTGSLAAIEPSARPDVPALDVKSIEDVRTLAEEFARKNSVRFNETVSNLAFEENGKGDIYFYTWRTQGIDWSETEWRMMPPFLQIGMSADGKLVSYINTLDLYKEPDK